MIEQYEYIGIRASIINKFKEGYSYVDKIIRYDLYMEMDSFNTKEIFDVGVYDTQNYISASEFVVTKAGRYYFRGFNWTYPISYDRT